MEVLIACDKFKGSLSAIDVCHAISSGLTKRDKNIRCIEQPMADGGDGSLEILHWYLHAQEIEMDTIDPLGRHIKGRYLTKDDTAYIELAIASGIILLSDTELNPRLSHTIGTGLLIKNALEKGHTHIVLFAGGSATNDAGLGIAYALGYKFFDKDENEVMPNGESLMTIKRIDKPENLSPFTLDVLTDVSNIMHGPDGAAYTYAGQKGATDEDIVLLDRGLMNIAKIIDRQWGIDVSQVVGGGSAGGLAAGLYGLCSATIKNGFEVISELTNLEEKIQRADIIISGEGKLDSQSLQGKVVGSIAGLCKKHGKRLILFVGINDLEFKENEDLLFEKIYDVISIAKDKKDGIEHGGEYLEALAFNAQLIE